MAKGTPNFTDLAADSIDALVAAGWKHSGVAAAGFWSITQLTRGKLVVDIYSPAGVKQDRVWLTPAKGGKRAESSAVEVLELAGIAPAERREKGVRLVRVVRRDRAKKNPPRGEELPSWRHPGKMTWYKVGPRRWEAYPEGAGGAYLVVQGYTAKEMKVAPGQPGSGTGDAFRLREAWAKAGRGTQMRSYRFLAAIRWRDEPGAILVGPRPDLDAAIQIAESRWRRQAEKQERRNPVRVPLGTVAAGAGLGYLAGRSSRRNSDWGWPRGSPYTGSGIPQSQAAEILRTAGSRGFRAPTALKALSRIFPDWERGDLIDAATSVSASMPPESSEVQQTYQILRGWAAQAPGRSPRRNRARANPIHGARRNPGATLASASSRTPPALNPPPGIRSQRWEEGRYLIHYRGKEIGWLEDTSSSWVMAGEPRSKSDQDRWRFMPKEGTYGEPDYGYKEPSFYRTKRDALADALSWIEGEQVNPPHRNPPGWEKDVEEMSNDDLYNYVFDHNLASPEELADMGHDGLFSLVWQYHAQKENPPLLPLTSSRRKWDATKARRALKKWATKNGRVDMKKYARGFLAYDGNPENLTSYKLPIAIPVRSKAGRLQLKAVPHAIYAAAAVIDGARGGVELPYSQRQKATAQLARYYKKMGKTPPWRR